MAEDATFFDKMTKCLTDEAARHPGQRISPEVWGDFMSEAKLVSPPVSEAAASTAPLDGLAACMQAAAGCGKCRLGATRRNMVFGEGDPHAALMFIGEGPGADEDQQGRPFVGKAGQLLDKMIVAMGYAREEVYIANIVKCRPPGNRNPEPDEAAACIGFLHAQIAAVSPRAIVLLGAVAARFLLQRQEGITRLRGNWTEYNGIPVMPTYHPSFLLRQESAKRDAWSDLKQVMAYLGKPLPVRR
ncbi:MAG: uracil-DNA glycosylase [Victivallaceae bacterium]|nr:uracil-DNA glycosylase [Victivallaceae bacterium]